MYKLLITIHALSALYWVGGLLFATFVLLYEMKQMDVVRAHRELLKRSVNLFRWHSLVAAGLLLLTGVLMIPERSYTEPARLTALFVMILGWCLLTAMVAGTIPGSSFSARPEDIEEKEQRDWNPNKLYWIHVASSVIAVVVFSAGVYLAYS